MAEYNESYSLFKSAISQNNSLFNVESYSQSIELPGDLGDLSVLKRTRLVSKGDIINVRDNFTWKNGGSPISTEEVPALLLEEKTLSMTGIAATLANVFNTAADRVDRLANQNQSFVSTLTEPYAKLYVIEDNAKHFKYKLPWLLNNGSNLRTVSNVWSDYKGNSTDSGSTKPTSTFGKIAGFLAGATAGAITPGMEIDPIFTYTTTDRMSLTVRFPLFNTYSVDETIQNFYFVTLLTYQNLKNRTSLVTFVPPSVYTISSEGFGGIYMPIAIIKELKINNMGTVRQIKDDIIQGQTILVPEAYDINITFQELLPQSTNIFEGAIGGVKVDVVDTSPIGVGPNTNIVQNR
jgi:hypothetical protein